LSIFIKKQGDVKNKFGNMSRESKAHHKNGCLSRKEEEEKKMNLALFI